MSATYTRLDETAGRVIARGWELVPRALARMRGADWVFLDQCLVSAANFITIFVFARYLHPDAFVGFMLGYAGLVVALFLLPHADLVQPSLRRFTSALVVLQAKRCIGISVGLTLAGCMVLAAGHEVAGSVVIVVALVALPCLGQDLVRRVLHARRGIRAAAVSDGLTYGLQIFGALVLVLAAAQWATAGSALSVLGLSSAMGLVVGCLQLRRHAPFEHRRDGEYGHAWTTHARSAPEARPLRILLSAYACEPDRGSEPGIGWRWALALAGAGHDVWVLTRANNRPAIEQALDRHPQPRLHFVYHDLPAWARWWKRRGRGVRLYYLLWQLGAYRVARELTRDVAFDVAHHITFGVFRHPSFLAFLDLPFVFGPVGGGETAPRELRETFPLRGYVSDLVRDAANWAVRIDPLMAAVYRRSSAMLCKTPETLQSIPPRYREKCVVQAEVGTDGRARPDVRGRQREETGFRVLYVGRLVYWKGLHLALTAFAMFRQMRPDARLTVIGSGPDEAWFRRIAWLLGLQSAITWVPWLEQAEVMRTYPRHDAFLFPSLHDSSGNAVLEALSCGVPVVCLDAGGPAVLVDASCGIRVAPGRPHEVVERLADALLDLAEDPVRLQAMGEAAARHAHDEFAWPRQAARMVGLYRTLCMKHPAHFGATGATA